MGCAAATAKRRRRQAVMGYRHLARLGKPGNSRPIFKKKSSDTLSRHQARLDEKRKAMMARKANSKR